ncbi:MAG TPA: VanZ family protein, partial [Burkholderiales bacterium]|nr:VanZ family protein [Burkholderiales bacterium]
MKKFLIFWLAPIVLMALVFPVGNKALASHRIYDLFVAVFRWLLPHASWHATGMGYIIFRKLGHFVTYGLLAFLFYRALRAGRRPRCRPAWFLWAGGMAAAYGLLDEFLQTLVPHRSGNLRDWAVDCAGAAAALALAAHRAKRLDEGRVPPPGPGSLSRALFLKRPFDIALALLGLVVSLPVSAAIALAVRLEDGGPVFYSQERVGRNGRTFRAFKFRSMIPGAEKGRGPVQAAENDPRTTRVGRVLRATAMDELPQLFNILKGDMSFVGPRALRPNE